MNARYVLACFDYDGQWGMPFAPEFFDQAVYELLASRGFRWTSNLEIRYLVELFRPDKLRSDTPWRLVSSRVQALDGTLARATLALLNPKVVGGRHLRPSLESTLRWLLAGCPPLYRGGLLELPLYSPLDCDLIGFPDPRSPTEEGLLNFAQFALARRLSAATPLRMLIFHDWIVSTGNWLRLLDGALSQIDQLGLEPTTVERSWSDLERLAINRETQ